MRWPWLLGALALIVALTMIYMSATDDTALDGGIFVYQGEGGSWWAQLELLCMPPRFETTLTVQFKGEGRPPEDGSYQYQLVVPDWGPVFSGAGSLPIVGKSTHQSESFTPTQTQLEAALVEMAVTSGDETDFWVLRAEGQRED